MDLRRVARLHVGVDDAQELIDRLCTAAGMIMEDTVDGCLFSNPLTQGERIAAIADAARDLATLADSASMIARRWLRHTHRS